MATLLLRPGKARVRAPRVEIDLMVESKTLGTQAAYRMSTLDVSKSGLLLSWERKGRMPFIENTILEMTIDPSSDSLNMPVLCLGKVIRRVDKEADELDDSAYIGVQIVQMEGQDINVWEQCLDELEKKHGVKISVLESPKEKVTKRAS